MVSAKNEFDVNKSHIIAKIKKEAEENVLKEKVLASLSLPPSSMESVADGENQGKVRRLPPQQCVILKPVSTLAPSESGRNDEELKDPPPIIIPGNPENSIRLLKDEKGINLIEKEIEKHYEQKISTSITSKEELGDHDTNEKKDNTTAIILTSLSSLDETTLDKSMNVGNFKMKEVPSFGKVNVKSLPPLRMKPQSSDEQEGISFKESSLDSPTKFMELNRSQSIPSRKCTVLDLLFDREDPFEDQISNPVENIPPPEPVPDDSRLSVIVFKNNKIVTTNEPCSVEGKKDLAPNSNIRSLSNKNVKYAIFDPSGLKSELDKYKEEVKTLRKENYGLKIKNQTLRNEKNKLTKKVEIREKLMETRRRKSKKDMDTIAKLRTELSKLRQLRNKMRRREYNRKAKHEKVLERRKKRRQFIQEQIDLGVMDKSQLSLVYSRKKLPYERKQTHHGPPNTQEKEKKNHMAAGNKVSGSHVPIGMTIVDQQSHSNLFATPTVEYIIEHDGQIEDTHVEGETVVQVENYYDQLETENIVSDNETNAAVAGISSSEFHQDVGQKETNSESVDVISSSYDTSYINVHSEHRYTTNTSSQKQGQGTVKIIRLQNPSNSIPRSSTSYIKNNVEGCPADSLEFIVKVLLTSDFDSPRIKKF